MHNDSDMFCSCFSSLLSSPSLMDARTLALFVSLSLVCLNFHYLQHGLILTTPIALESKAISDVCWLIVYTGQRKHTDTSVSKVCLQAVTLKGVKSCTHAYTVICISTYFYADQSIHVKWTSLENWSPPFLIFVNLLL